MTQHPATATHAMSSRDVALLLHVREGLLPLQGLRPLLLHVAGRIAGQAEMADRPSRSSMLEHDSAAPPARDARTGSRSAAFTANSSHAVVETQAAFDISSRGRGSETEPGISKPCK
jgi:hypothetical protein